MKQLVMSFKISLPWQSSTYFSFIRYCKMNFCPVNTVPIIDWRKKFVTQWIEKPIPTWFWKCLISRRAGKNNNSVKFWNTPQNLRMIPSPELLEKLYFALYQKNIRYTVRILEIIRWDKQIKTVTLIIFVLQINILDKIFWIPILLYVYFLLKMVIIFHCNLFPYHFKIK